MAFSIPRGGSVKETAARPRWAAARSGIPTETCIAARKKRRREENSSDGGIWKPSKATSAAFCLDMGKFKSTKKGG
ncbi:MAG: hypothetical protein WBP72_17420, partial [Rhodocyclaceae bacterium]